MAVLLASVPEHLVGRVQSVLELGAAEGVVGVIRGQWGAGASVLVERGGLTTATSPGAPPSLNGARLVSPPPWQAAPLLRLLAYAAATSKAISDPAASAGTRVDDAAESDESPAPESSQTSRRRTVESTPQQSRPGEDTGERHRLATETVSDRRRPQDRPACTSRGDRAAAAAGAGTAIADAHQRPTRPTTWARTSC